VLHDVTTRTWLWRHMARAIVLTLTAVVVVFVPLILLVHVVFWLAIAAVVLGVLVSVYYSMSYAWESGDVRLTKYGYPDGYGSQERQRIADERDRETQERYNATWRQG
jgi:CHASE2 domain-containing sensor protein